MLERKRRLYPAMLAFILTVLSVQPSNAEILFNLRGSEQEEVTRELGARLFRAVSLIFDALAAFELGDIDGANSILRDSDFPGIVDGYAGIQVPEFTIGIELISAVDPGRAAFVSDRFSVYNLELPADLGQVMAITVNELASLDATVKQVELTGTDKDLVTVRNLYGSIFRVLDIGAIVPEFSRFAQ